jgi:glycosyltransferase involved in cell wall biosynthesis
MLLRTASNYGVMFVKNIQLHRVIMKKILIVVNIPKFFVSHWLDTAHAAKAEGYEVHIATSAGADVAIIKNAGFIHHTIALERSSKNIIKEFKCIFDLIKLFRNVQPDLVHLITIKPVIYGGIAAKFSGVGAILSAVTGLGYVFINTSSKKFTLAQIVRRLYKSAFSHKNIKVVFENEADQETFVTAGLIPNARTTVIHGAGVRLQEYKHVQEPDDNLTITFAARLLKDKGIIEFLEASNTVKAVRQVKFRVVGDIDPDNPASITQQELDIFKSVYDVEFCGFRTDIAKIFSESNIVVLPSYREGLPKVLIEAASCGRAVITTDVPGCRHVILPDQTGLLVPVRDSKSLAEAIIKLVDDAELRKRMGTNGRKLAEEKFADTHIAKSYMNSYQSLIAEQENQKKNI